MGVPQLNHLIKKYCPGCIKTIHFDEIKNKTLVVDISIYLYKFNLTGSIIDGLYQFINIFSQHNINLIFVFDGKSPKIKEATILQRRREKDVFKKKYIELEKELDNVSDKVERSCILKDLSFLKKRAFGLPKNTYALVKECISNAGYIYYDANEEADTLCVKLVQEKAAWGCLSDDMDMFVYGCPRIIRSMRLFEKTALLYDYNSIIHSLNITPYHFRLMCNISGTDYTPTAIKTSIIDLYKWYVLLKNKEDLITCVPDKYKQKVIDIAHLFNINNSSSDLLGNKCLPQQLKHSEKYLQFLESHNFIFPMNIKDNYKRV